MVGLKGAGKITILFKLKLGENTNGLTCVLDSNDRHRFNEAKAEFNKLMKESL